MKLWLVVIMILGGFTGCVPTKKTIQLENQNEQQARVIKQQKAYIKLLKEKLNKRYKYKKRTRTRRKIRTKTKTKVKTKVKQTTLKAPKKNIKLKKVEDNNYSAGYMYPGETKKKPVKVAQTTKNTTMTKSECISMIGQAKFDKYTQMFGNEAASLKRCSMIKAMK